jgi:hypothetical protein
MGMGISCVTPWYLVVVHLLVGAVWLLYREYWWYDWDRYIGVVTRDGVVLMPHNYITTNR